MHCVWNRYYLNATSSLCIQRPLLLEASNIKKKTPILHDSGKDLIMTRFENEQQPAAFFYSIHHKNRTL